MTDLKYGKYILKGKTPEKPHAPVALDGLEDWGGIKLRISWQYITRPAVLVDVPHTHDFDEFLIFLSHNPAEPKDFGAEIEISLGKEQEVHAINSNSVVCVPKGLIHGPLKFRKIENSVLFAVIYLSPEYARKPAKALPPAKTNGAMYRKYILREPKGEIPRRKDTEEWGVCVNQETTSGAGKFNCNFNFLGILKPHVLPDPPHEHNCDEFLFLIPSTRENWPELGGEAEIAIGDDWEKQSIDTAAVICLPAGVRHCPVYMKNVDTPFYWGHVLLAPSYDSSAYDPEQYT